MSSEKNQDGQIKELLQLWCDERLDDAQSAELAELLATSDTARRRYVETVQLSVALADWSQPVDPATAPGEQAAAMDTAQQIERNGDSNGLAQPLTAPNPRRIEKLWRPLLAVAAVLLLSATTFWGWSQKPGAGSGEQGVASSDSQLPPPGSPLAEQALEGTFIARVVELTPDAEWDNDFRPREFFMRLRAGEQLQLESGLAHLEFYSGAHIILHGPSKFIPTGPAAGKLESGRLTGKVEGGDFLLTTPTAKVVDLGTEFGVTVGALSNTDVCVFDGEVEVQPGLAGLEDRQPQAPSHNLTQGMSVRVAATGQVSDGQQAGVESELFTRSFPLPSGTDATVLDLVDIICGGNGRGQRLAAAIDPLTGEWDQRPWKDIAGGTRRGNLVYHVSSWHPFLDGTFIPNQVGEPCQVDSLGQTIRLPKDCGDYTWGPLWARRVVKDASQIEDDADAWRAETFPVITDRLSRCRLGGIGLHASIGITFDLGAIGQQHQGRIERLRGILTNLDNSKAHNPEWAKENPRPSADFYVFVDGELRYEQLNFARNVEGVPFEVELSPTDRFLTFVTTDGGDTNRYDHIVIIDPVLIVQEAAPEKLSALWQRFGSPAAGASRATATYQWPTR